MTEEEAIAYVTRTAQAEIFPCVEETVIQEIVGRHLRAAVWEAETAYSFGARVQPTTPNGHFYKVFENGTSATTEPEWNKVRNSKTYDGDDLIWLECETDTDGSRYNLRNAIHEVWNLKASMVSNQFDTKLDTETYNRSQIFKFCQEMAAAYAPIE